jgi:hypothetical protein
VVAESFVRPRQQKNTNPCTILWRGTIFCTVCTFALAPSANKNPYRGKGKRANPDNLAKPRQKISTAFRQIPIFIRPNPWGLLYFKYIFEALIAFMF